MMELFTRKRVPGRAAEIKQWVAARLSLGDDDMVAVAQLSCHEPGCPPVETVLTLRPARGTPRMVRIHKPLAEITEDDVVAALSDPS